ncbi:MAG: class I SAM-dependent methyltransferase [Candidatus Sumerlaeota bacterium]|nr:class I SAM-dependent methyltransferase [Candidatus Sumerlaeota bacterium]
MLLHEDTVAEMFEAIRAIDRAGINEQFKSLPAAGQYRLLYQLAAQYAAPDARVLDWGCGRGHFSYFLLKRGFNVTAYSLEPAPEIFGALSPSERARLTFVRGSLDAPAALPFESQSFDAIFSVGVLEHVRELGGDELASLRELRRLLAGDGVLICYHFPNRHSYIEALSRAIHGRRTAQAPERFRYHQYAFALPDIKRLCREADLALVEWRRYGFLPRNSFNRLPPSLRRSRALAAAVNRADLVLERLFAPIVQNYCFAARPASETL